MKINILTIFPQFFESPLSCGLVSKAREKGIVEFNLLDLRDFTFNRQRNVDDRPYGGGPGMVMGLDAPVGAFAHLGGGGRRIMLSPKGRRLDQALARELAQEEEITLLCGRYEGIDARLDEVYPIEPVSVGDFVLNGGETGALCLIESVGRLLPGYMGHEGSADEESFSSGLLEYPHYTRPEEYEGLSVPEVLRSGDHGRIAKWRREQALRETLTLRPDLLAEAPLDDGDVAFLRARSRWRPGKNLFLALVHYPVVNKEKKMVTTSLTNLDVHDIARVSRTYGLGGYFICTPIKDQQTLAGQLLAYWLEGGGSGANPDRGEALSLVRVVGLLENAVAEIENLTGKRPRVVATSARAGDMPVSRARAWLEDRPVLLVMGTGYGLAPKVIEQADGLLRGIRFLDSYNHLSVRSATSILVDRLLGDVL
jgi:tRNA (guanine37-N1)-methyltransferase